MNKNATIWIAIAGGGVSIIALIAISIYFSWKYNTETQIEYTASIADEVLRRSRDGAFQVQAIYKELNSSGASEPCAEKNIELMKKLDLKSEQIQIAGYVKDDVFRCSSHGHHDIYIGPPTYSTPYGSEVRTSFEFPILPGISFLLLTEKSTGYTVAIHQKTILGILTEDPRISLGLYSLSSKRLIVGRGMFLHQWPERLGNEQQVQFIDRDNFVVIRRSGELDLASFAAIPGATVNRGLYEMAMVLVPIGVVAGGLLSIAFLNLARQQLTMPALIKVALKRREFFMQYQPVVDLKTGLWVGAEALIRWRRPSGEMVRPDVFIKAAEEAGIVQKITAHVMEMVAHDAQKFFLNHPEFHIAINLSAADLESKITTEWLSKLLAQTGARPGNLLVEATERGFMKADVVREVFRKIRDMGIYVAIDDFGTGYSSLSYLESFEIDYLKIDKSFVDTLGKESATSQVAPHIIEMAKSLKLIMIAEGVESEDQAKYLRENGVQFAQGWFFAKPMSFSELVAGLTSLKSKN